MKQFLVCLFFSFLLISCEKDIQLAPESQEPKLVVDAQIETGQPPVVILTKSLNYFSTISSSQLTGSFVRNAEVILSNGTQTHRLREYNIVNNGIVYYFYSNDITSPASSFIGENGKQYNLSITVDGQLYTSTTYIPVLTKKMDSLWWKKPPTSVDTNFAIVMAKITDPPGLGNYIRYFTQRGKNAPFLPGDNSVFDDQVIDGKTYDVSVAAGVDRNRPPSSLDSSGYFYRGDTVTVKFCNIDQNTYKFWNTWEFAFQAIGNPFSSPVKVTNNISNNALGSFCGYATQFKTVIIPK
jgi:hypothetical protein